MVKLQDNGCMGIAVAALLLGTVVCAQPPVEIIRLETNALLEARVNAAVEPEAVAKELQLSWPVAAPSKAPAEIEAELARRLRSRAATAPVEIDEAALQARAERKVPLAKVGEVVALTLATGGELRGELEAFTAGSVKVDGRTLRTSALTPAALALLDPTANAAVREAWLQRERVRLMGEAETTVIGGRAKLREQLYQAAGYVRWRQQWVSPIALLDKAVAYRREQLTRQLRPAAVNEVAARYGYRWQDGNWLPLAPPAETASAPPAPAEPPLPPAEEPPAPTGVEALFDLELPGKPPAPTTLPPPLTLDF